MNYYKKLNGTFVKWTSEKWLRVLRRRSAGRSPAETVGSNPTEVMDICLL